MQPPTISYLTNIYFETGAAGLLADVLAQHAIARPLIVTDDVAMRTLPVGLQAFAGQFGTEYHKVMAAATLVVIPVLVFFIVLQKQILRGIALTSGAK